jgi:arginine/lysine/ornithine decarboxylase
MNACRFLFALSDLSSIMNHMKKEPERISGQLEKQLRDYTESGWIPFHMPGHKRQINVTGALDSTLDFTEVEETDDLHHPSGILKDAMARTAQLYGAERTWYLVNGSTCGCLAGIFALTHDGGEVIAARNLHRSLYHALQLRRLQVHWLLPPLLKDYETYGSIPPEAVEEALERYPRAEAVILTSPTYEGIISDIAAISSIAHQHHVPVFVDEAHGAHLGFGSFPMGAVQSGADLVVQSPHKTLFSATQTAWLHLNGDLVREQEVEKQLGIFETSSPSYPLMMSLDGCSEAWRNSGSRYAQQWLDHLHQFDEQTRDLHRIRILEHSPHEHHAEIFAFDPSKLLIHSPLSGKELMAILHDRYHCTMEMAEGHQVLAMTSAADDPADLDILAQALQELDPVMPSAEKTHLFTFRLPEARLRIHDAVEQEQESVSWDQAAGRIAGEYVFLYPPGIPLIVPGEIISSEQLALLEEEQAEGYEIRTSASADGRLLVCSQK